MNETVETPGTPMPDTSPPEESPGREQPELPSEDEEQPEGDRYDGGEIPNDDNGDLESEE